MAMQGEKKKFSNRLTAQHRRRKRAEMREKTAESAH